MPAKPGPASRRLVATPAGVKLGTVAAVPAGGARKYVVQMRAGRFHGFVVRENGEVFGFVDRSPHMSLPLSQVLDNYLTPAGDLIACSSHGALFEKSTGLVTSPRFLPPV